MTPTRETIAAWTQGQKKNVISSGSGSLRALEASGRRQRLSTTATPPKTPLLADSRCGVATQFCNLAAAPETRQATALAPGDSAITIHLHSR